MRPSRQLERRSVVRASRLPCQIGIAAALWLWSAVAFATDQPPAELTLTDLPRAELTLEEVRASTIEHFPQMRVIEAERTIRREQLREARGSFDLRLGLAGDLRPEGFYENYAGSVGLEQPTKLYGARVYSGYRYGGGDFPSYEGARLTDANGEVSAGLEIPLLRGGRIDAPRADLAKAEIRLERASPEIALQRIAILRDAAVTYWAWVSAGKRLDVAEELLSLAADRQSQIARRTSRGAQPRIDLTDNERLIAERSAILRGAERDFAKAAIRLSLYLRDEEGNAVRPLRAQLPAGFPEEEAPDLNQFENDLDQARKTHVLLAQFELDRQALVVDRDLARNELLPAMNFRVEASQDFGDPSPGIDTSGKLSAAPRSETEVKALIRFDLPVQRRKAKGRLGVATIRLSQLENRKRLVGDRIVADVLQAIEELEAAYEQTAQARENLRLAEKLRSAEERKLELGGSNLINVNIREVQAANAALGLVDAQLSYFRARVDYEARLARPS